MWKTVSELNSFLEAINGRLRTTLLLETKEAVEIVDDVLENPLIDEIHIGFNGLHRVMDLHLCLDFYQTV